MTSSVVALAAEERRPPNIVFILADDLGWKDTEPYGSQFHRTPNLIRLANRGMLFRNAYAASPLCSPTRASILTGQWPARLRFTTPAGHLEEAILDPIVPLNGPPHHPVVSPQTRTRLPNEMVTSAELLKSAGYRTALMGKWHLGRAPHLPENQGFDVVVGGRHHPGPPGGYFAPFKDIDTIPDAKDGDHVDDILGSEAVKFIHANREQPFFLNLWFYSVHAPFQGKPDLIRQAAERMSEFSELDEHVRPGSPTMAAMVETMDDNIGRVLDAIDEAGLRDNTVIIFTSDNGGNMYDNVGGTTPTSNAPLRGGKGCIFEGGQRVPLIVEWPGHVKAGSIAEEIVTSVDYFPTLMEIAGVAVPESLTLDGESIVPVITQTGALHREAIFCHFPHYTPATGNFPAVSVRSGDWKLIRFFGRNADRTDRLELYHLKDDVGERTNVAASHVDLVQDLNQRIDGFLSSTHALTPRPNPRYRSPVAGWTHAGQSVASTSPLVIPAKRSQAFSIRTEDIPPIVARPARLNLQLQTDGPSSGTVHWSGPQGAKQQKRFELQGSDREQLIRIDLPVSSLLLNLEIEFAAAASPIELQRIELTLPENPIRSWNFRLP